MVQSNNNLARHLLIYVRRKETDDNGQTSECNRRKKHSGIRLRIGRLISRSADSQYFIRYSRYAYKRTGGKTTEERGDRTGGETCCCHGGNDDGGYSFSEAVAQD
jgi:hypothetical protein